ncbi:MAG TPA: hypothetical protein VFJ43_11840, partial [Bacteroidia bacterium]|nr:hypothetical protein [Bacteroidia bacterium]
LSMKNEFSNSFIQLMNQNGNGNKETEIEITPKHFPFFLRDRELIGKAWSVLVKCKNDSGFLENTSVRFQFSDQKTISGKPFAPYQNMNLFQGSYFRIDKTDTSPLGKWTIEFESEDIDKINPESIEDIWLVSDYKIRETN